MIGEGGLSGCPKSLIYPTIGFPQARWVLALMDKYSASQNDNFTLEEWSLAFREIDLTQAPRDERGQFCCYVRRHVGLIPAELPDPDYGGQIFLQLESTVVWRSESSALSPPLWELMSAR
jgi:hypothetical protein